jgi:hypothetical protein
MREAAFSARGASVGPVTVDASLGERVARIYGSAREATIVALMACGIVKAGSGNVLVEEYDPRVQAAHCKRIAGFVPHAPMDVEEWDLDRYVAYRAALWDVDPMRALAHAKLLMERLDGVHEAFAYPIVGALIASPKLLVFDRPQAAYARSILAAAGPRAIFSTHVNDEAARAFSVPLEESLVTA